MKNIKRLALLIALIFFATQVLSSDFEFIKSDDSKTQVAIK